MVLNQQVRRLRMFINKGLRQYQAADKAGMSERSARKYLKSGQMPDEMAKPHDWRTRRDPFEASWPHIRELLEANPGLEAKTVFEHIQRQSPGIYQDNQLRTLQRRFKHWRATQGPAKEVFFPQVHIPGELSASDFTDMRAMGITIRKEAFDHLLYHFVLTYSNWEDASIVFSESFESLSTGYQAAVWRLGGVAQKHRTDRMSAAVNKACNPEHFTSRYSALLRHYSVEPQRTNPASGNENGDVEQRHYRLKKAIDQALMLRGSRDFDTRQEYELFLRNILEQLNAGRQKRLEEELAVLGRLPERKLDSCSEKEVRVGPSSTICIRHNTYSVHSRLIGERVRVKMYLHHLEVWHGQRNVESIPRLRGESHCRIDYRHIIDWLVRKPGAFENYRYKSEMFPSSYFRMAYDQLKRCNPLRANKEYIIILDTASKQGELRTEAVLRELLSGGQEISAEKIRELTSRQNVLPKPSDIVIDPVCLRNYDQLLCMPQEEVSHA